MADTSSLLYDYGSLQTTNIHLAMSPLLPPLIQDKDNHNLDVNPTTKQTTGITNAFLTKTQRVQFGLLTLAKLFKYIPITHLTINVNKQLLFVKTHLRTGGLKQSRKTKWMLLVMMVNLVRREPFLALVLHQMIKTKEIKIDYCDVMKLARFLQRQFKSAWVNQEVLRNHETSCCQDIPYLFEIIEIVGLMPHSILKVNCESIANYFFCDIQAYLQVGIASVVLNSTRQLSELFIQLDEQDQYKK